MNKILRYSFVALMAMLFGNSYAAWEKATSIAVGDVIVIAVDNGTVTKELKGIGMAGSNSIGEAEDYTGSTPAGLYPLSVVAGSQSGSFAFKNGDNYLSWTSGNTLTTSTEINDNSSWTVTFNDGVPTINNVQTAVRDLSYNASSPRFACYGNTNQTRVTLWKQVSGGGSGKTATTINFAEGYKTKIGRGPDEMFPELGSFVALPTATVKAGDAVVSSEVEWTLDLTSWDGKEGEAQPSINDGKINNLNNGSGLITVKASYAGSETYEASTKSYDLKVYSPYGLLSEMVGDIFDPTFEKDDMNDKDGKPVFYFFRNIDAAGIPVVTNTVTFVSGNYIYLTDGTANLLFYGNNSQNLKKGDVISGNVSDTNLGGFWGNLKRYNKLPEFAFTDMNVKVESEGATVTPKTIKIDELAANINNYVKVENAEFVSASGKNLTFKVGETTLAVYNQFSVDATTLEATAMYTIEAMGSVYKKNKDTDAVYQLYPISFTKQGGGSDPTPSGDFYAWEDGMEAANKLTFADGSTVQITGNETKTIGSAKKITIDGNEYTTLKISNGAENTFVLPAGKKAKNVTFYSYVNKATAEAADRDNYWADVNGTAYDAAAKGTMKDFTDSEDYLLHPDVYTFELGGVNSFTFKNAGYQPCIVIRVALDDASNINTVKTAIIDGTRYNLAGQKVDKSYKGVVIMNGKKMIQK